MLARFGLVGWLIVPPLALAACGGGAPAASPTAEAPAAPRSASAPAAGAPAPTAAVPATASAPPPAATLKIAAQPSIASAARYVALDRGYLREQGIELEEVPSTTSAQMLPSLAAGQVDMGLGGAAAGIFNAIAQGIPVRLTLDMWTAYPGNQSGGLFVRQDLIDTGQVRDLRDLAGLRTGVTSKGQATEYALNAALTQGGLSLADVDTAEMSYPDMTVA